MAAAVLALLSFDNDDNKVTIAQAGGIPPLVALTRSSTDLEKLAGAEALMHLASGNNDNRVAIAQAGGIAPLVALALGGSGEHKRCARGALEELARNADNKVAIRVAIIDANRLA